MEDVCPLEDAENALLFGGKAANLAKLLRAGFSVPEGFAVGIRAFSKNGTLTSAAKKYVEDLTNASKLYAVRSSALAEDSLGASWAGQFETFLYTPAKEVSAKIEDCHNSTKARAKVYAEGSGESNKFQIAVVVQEMIDPDFAGLIFTKDPSTGANNMIIEYVQGIGEPLVHGDVDPERIFWSRTAHRIKDQTEANITIPFKHLIKVAQEVESIFDSTPQDIEWAYNGQKLWLVQSRPITTLQDRGTGKHYLGEPGNLFYWGPSRATPLYMSDFTEAAAKFFAQTIKDSSLPDAPKTLVLYHEDKVVWLLKAKPFGKFATDMFRVYERMHEVSTDKVEWQKATYNLDEYVSKSKNLDVRIVSNLLEAAWKPTLMPEFSLYGAEAVLHERLARFDSKARQEIWGSMTLPDKPTFMQQIDIELAVSDSPSKAALKYPWIQDGYYGVVGNALSYFTNRKKVTQGNVLTDAGSLDKREAIIRKYNLNSRECRALELTRELSDFMDERKAWMMRTRKYIQQAARTALTELGIDLKQVNATTLLRLANGRSEAYFGSSFLQGKNIELTAEDVNLAWDWYVEFRAAHTVLRGLVASSGGQHFTNGKVFVANSPQDAMPDNSILVVPSTSPSYVPLMRQARALVTDHGGIMSHAAIVAREFRLPCIVGTKRATKILKNGDKVVLDLVKGEVNK